MNRRQSAKFASHSAVEALLKATTETSGIPGLPASLTALSARLDELNVLGETQLQPTRPKIAWREETLQDMIDAAVTVAGVVSTHAHRQKLIDLAKEMEISDASFRRLRRDHRPWLGQRVHDLAQPIVDQLAPLGVTAETLADLQAKIDAVRGALLQPRSTIVEKRSATAHMARLFGEIEELLEREIDPQVRPLRKTNPQFYTAYVAARRAARLRHRADDDAPTTAVAATTVTPVADAPMSQSIAA